MIQSSCDIEDVVPGRHMSGHVEDSREWRDGVHDFLLLLADIYNAYPELYHNEDLK